MEKLIIGIDLCDNYTQAAVLGREDAWMLPTVICRKKAAEEWYVGEDAYKYTLVGEGVIVDKLLSLAAKEGTSTIGGVKYGGMELLQRFLGSILAMVRAEYGGQKIDELVISLKNMEMKHLEGHPYRKPHGMFCPLCVKPEERRLGRPGGDVLPVG